MTWRNRIETEVLLASAGNLALAYALDGNLQALNIKRGRAKGVERMTPGTSSISLVLADTAAWTAENAPGDPLWLGSLVRVRARVDGGTWRDLYIGTVRSIRDEWQLDGRLKITLAAVDHLGTLASVTPEPAASLGVQAIVPRLQAINQMAPGPVVTGLGPTSEDFGATGGPTLQASDMTRNLLDEAMLAAESDNGELWGGRGTSSVLRYRTWDALMASARSANDQLVWTNMSWSTSVWDTATWDSGVWGSAGVKVGTRTFATEMDTEELVNEVTLQRVGGTAVTRSADAGTTVYGRHTYQRTDLIAGDDAAIHQRAAWLLWQLSDRTARFDKLTTLLDPAASAALLDGLLDIELHDRHRIVWDTIAGTYDLPVHVQGVEHSVSGDTWTVGVSLWHYVGS